MGTQNGTNPQRVIRMQLAPNGQAITRVDTLASNERDFDDITLGVVTGDLFFNSAAQWNLYGDDGKAPAPEKLRPAQVLRIRLRSSVKVSGFREAHRGEPPIAGERVPWLAAAHARRHT